MEWIPVVESILLRGREYLFVLESYRSDAVDLELQMSWIPSFSAEGLWETAIQKSSAKWATNQASKSLIASPASASTLYDALLFLPVSHVQIPEF